MVAQLLANGLLAASVAALMALAVAIPFFVLRFFNFYYAAAIPCGAYAAYVSSTYGSFSLAGSVLMAGLLAATLGIAAEMGIFVRVRRRGAGALSELLASLGLYAVLQNLISMVFGDEMKALAPGTSVRVIDLGGARLTTLQAGTILIAIVLVAGVMLAGSVSRIGLAYRAVSIDESLAAVLGLPARAVQVLAVGLGSFIAGFAGALVGCDVGVAPTMGMDYFMMGIVVTIVGGIGSFEGLAWGALLLGLVQQVGAWFLGGNWQAAIAMGTLFVFLVFRPSGIGSIWSRFARRGA